MESKSEKRVRGMSLLVSQLSKQNRGSYSDDDLYDDDFDEKTVEEPEPRVLSLPLKLSRVAPSVSLSSVSVATSVPRTSYAFDAASAIRAVVTSSMMTSVNSTIASQVTHVSGGSMKRGQPGNPLVWQSGRLESILLHDEPSRVVLSKQPSTSNSHAVLRGHLRTVTSKSTVSPHLFPVMPRPKRGRPRGRPRRMWGPQNQGTGENVDDCATDGQEDHGRFMTSSALERSTATTPWPPKALTPRVYKRLNPTSKEDPLLLPIKEHHSPPNMSLPMLDLTAKHDPLAAIDAERRLPGAPAQTGETGASHPSGSSVVQPSAPSNSLSGLVNRMKSSGGLGDDIDPQELKNYRRLNGYTLFVLVNKRKYDAAASVPTDDAADSVDGQNRKWQAIWSTLPEKTRKQWKAKARRLLKQSTQQTKRTEWDKGRRLADRRKLENQIARTDAVSCSLLDIAAYFQLLSDSFASYTRQLSGNEGPVSPESVETLLLDGLLACMIPLLALVSEEEILSSVPDKRDVCTGLKSLTYIIPL
ncbi:hypothetical protein EG68_08970 [Paragonimus skrjabini miyazakii]|uniref:HMG box domain-containing protein n=1 Tax=Paragonimus skrjabini miyazakii TaxID=59628 RepID=A0A8S9YC05_9TREM|nr:hypothetical protein EG68_08970 [Paragonimus skrjabini miyazakii]